MNTPLYFAGTAAYGTSSMREAMDAYLQLAIYNLNFKREFGNLVLGDDHQEGLLIKEADAIKEAGNREAASYRDQGIGQLVGGGAALVSTIGGSIYQRSVNLKDVENQINTCESNKKALTTQTQNLIGGNSMGDATEMSNLHASPHPEVVKSFKEKDYTSHLLTDAEKETFNEMSSRDQEGIKKTIMDQTREVERKRGDLVAEKNQKMQLFNSISQLSSQISQGSAQWAASSETAKKAQADAERQVWTTINSMINGQTIQTADTSQRNGEQQLQGILAAEASLFEASHRG